MKWFMFALLGISMLGYTGCTTTVTNNTGTAVWAGVTTHQVYTKVAEKQGAAITNEIEALWVEIDSVKTPMELTNVYAHVANSIDTLIQKKSLTDKQTKILKILRKVLDKVVARALSEDSVARDNAIKWLKYYREGIRLMRKLENGEEIPEETVDAICDDCAITVEE